MAISKEQAEVISLLTDIFIKLALATSSIAAFWYILFVIINSASKEINWALAFLDTMLCGTIYYIIAHYFPAIKAAAKNKPTVKKNT